MYYLYSEVIGNGTAVLAVSRKWILDSAHLARPGSGRKMESVLYCTQYKYTVYPHTLLGTIPCGPPWWRMPSTWQMPKKSPLWWFWLKSLIDNEELIHVHSKKLCRSSITLNTWQTGMRKLMHVQQLVGKPAFSNAFPRFKNSANYSGNFDGFYLSVFIETQFSKVWSILIMFKMVTFPIVCWFITRNCLGIEHFAYQLMHVCIRTIANNYHDTKSWNDENSSSNNTRICSALVVNQIQQSTTSI
jgi:hypothetical protein